jgi:hypothetical protein
MGSRAGRVESRLALTLASIASRAPAFREPAANHCRHQTNVAPARDCRFRCLRASEPGSLGYEPQLGTFPVQTQLPLLGQQVQRLPPQVHFI